MNVFPTQTQEKIIKDSRFIIRKPGAGEPKANAIIFPSRLPKETSLGRMIPKYGRNHTLALCRAGTEKIELKIDDNMWIINLIKR